MTRYTNPFNTETGMEPYGYPQGQQPMQTNAGPIQTRPDWGQRGWKSYSPEPEPRFIPILGRYVNDPREIMPKEVQMDGNFYFFPKFDNSEIYAKIWTQDGELRTFRFLPEKEEPPQAQFPQVDEMVQQTLQSFGNAIDQRLQEFESRMNDILAPFTSQNQPTEPKTNRTTKKGE